MAYYDGNEQLLNVNLHTTETTGSDIVVFPDTLTCENPYYGFGLLYSSELYEAGKNADFLKVTIHTEAPSESGYDRTFIFIRCANANNTPVFIGWNSYNDTFNSAKLILEEHGENTFYFC